MVGCKGSLVGCGLDSGSLSSGILLAFLGVATVLTMEGRLSLIAPTTRFHLSCRPSVSGLKEEASEPGARSGWYGGLWEVLPVASGCGFSGVSWKDIYC